MKQYLLLLFFLITATVLPAKQDKRVYITLDVSGSMSGSKYVLANYTTQMIVTLCDDDDEVHMLVYGADMCLSKKKSPLKVIQKPMYTLTFGKGLGSTSQFDDIRGFNRIYEPTEKKQDWLFIIGDGWWDTMDKKYKKDREIFSNTINKGTVNICYLQTGESMNEESDFKAFASSFGVIDIGKSDVTPPTIKKGCDHFARKILGFSKTPLTTKKTSGNSIRIKTELPLTAFYLVYQDQTKPEELPEIERVMVGSKPLPAVLRGTPTTIPLKTNANEVTLSGNVYHIDGGSSIKAQTEIEVTFDKNIDPKNISIYPIVEDLTFSSISFAPQGGNLKQLDSRTSSICKDEKKALVRIELGDKSVSKLPESLLKKSKVVVKANNKDYSTVYQNGGFECEIDLIEDETQYYAECDCPGYFSRVTPIMTIVKGECEPTEPPVKEMSRVDLGTMTFSQLKGQPIRGIIQDAESLEQLDPEKFDITVEIENDFMYEKPSLSIEGNEIVIDVKPRGDWCECLFPTDLEMTVTSTPKSGAYGDKHYVKAVTPLHLKIEKDRPWLSRCFWVLVTLVALLLFVIYLRALLQKKRFKKNAMLTAKYYSYYGDLIDDQGGRKLRKDGFGAWFARWFLPSDERITMYIDKPAINSLTLIASESKEVVRILRSCCDFETMYISGYDPDTDVTRSKTISLGDQGTIEITDTSGAKEGEVVFTSGSENDGAGYRMLLSLLMIASLIAMAVLIWLIIKSF